MNKEFAIHDKVKKKLPVLSVSMHIITNNLFNIQLLSLNYFLIKNFPQKSKHNSNRVNMSTS